MHERYRPYDSLTISDPDEHGILTITIDTPGKLNAVDEAKHAAAIDSPHVLKALDLAEYCGLMVETLIGLGLLKHALILIDDVDLLEKGRHGELRGLLNRLIGLLFQSGFARQHRGDDP